MKKTNVLAAKIAGAGALALLMAASAFAEGRPQDRTWRDGDQRETHRRDDGRRNDGYRDDGYRDRRHDSRDSYRTYRENERVQMNGRISRYSRERDGYRLWLDHGHYPFWVPQTHWGRYWQVGVNIALGGVFRGGTVYIDGDRYDDHDRYRERQYGDYVRGYVDRIDYRSEVLVLRDVRTHRTVRVDMRRTDRGRSGLDLRDIRRGDRVTLVGQWVRGDVFAAHEIDAVNSGRY